MHQGGEGGERRQTNDLRGFRPLRVGMAQPEVPPANKIRILVVGNLALANVRAAYRRDDGGNHSLAGSDYVQRHAGVEKRFASGISAMRILTDKMQFAEIGGYVVIDVLDATPETLPGNMREIKAALNLKGPTLWCSSPPCSKDARARRTWR